MREMTNEQIDAEIAEKVLGLTRCDGTENHDANTCYMVDSDGSCWHHAGLVPINPSSDWSAAAMVVERMKKTHHVHIQWPVLGLAHSNCWEVIFDCPDSIHGPHGHAYDKSLPRAVCLAALAAERGGK